MNGMLSRPGTAGASSGDADLHDRLVMPVVRLLRQLGEVVGRLADGQYVRKPVGVIESSVGGHVRHCLDHVGALLAAVDTGHLDYDHRERGTPVESSRACAVERIGALAGRFEALPAGVLTRPLTVAVTMCADGPPVDALSSVGRELGFVLSHTIHHNAIVGAMVKTLGGWLPERFGYAPATIRHMDGQRRETAEGPCAR